MAVRTLTTRGGYVSAAEAQARKLQKVQSSTYPADAKSVPGGAHPNPGTEQSGGANLHGGTA